MRWLDTYVRHPARFAIESTIAITGLPVARRLRWITWPKVVLGGMLGNLYHRSGVPFEYTPLFSLPALAAGAYFLYAGPVWLGVLLCAFHTINDMADGVATGLYVTEVGEARRPIGRIKIRRLLDTYVSDVVSRFVLYLVFVLLLHEAHLVHPLLLLTLIVVEIVTIMLSSETESRDRRLAFHYEFVLEKHAGRRLFGASYPLQVIVGQVTSYQVYCLAPLLGYVWPLGRYGEALFTMLLVTRLVTMLHHLRGTLGHLASARDQCD